jgi:hypothetical protein
LWRTFLFAPKTPGSTLRALNFAPSTPLPTITVDALIIAKAALPSAKPKLSTLELVMMAI